MTMRELIALGITIDNPNTNPTNQSTTTTTMATAASQVNPFHNVIDINATEGKKLHQKATQGLPENLRHKWDSRDIIAFIEQIQSKSEDFGWDSITTNIGPDNMNLFTTLDKLTVGECKDHCDPKWADGSDEGNAQFCIKSNMFYLFVKNSCDQSVMDDMKDDKHVGRNLVVVMALHHW